MQITEVRTESRANVGSEYDAMPVENDRKGVEFGKLLIPNSVLRPARILANPRCPTVSILAAGVSHTQVALDLSEKAMMVYLLPLFWLIGKTHWRFFVCKGSICDER